jgi:hypothetical protein
LDAQLSPENSTQLYFRRASGRLELNRTGYRLLVKSIVTGLFMPKLKCHCTLKASCWLCGFRWSSSPSNWGEEGSLIAVKVLFGSCGHKSDRHLVVIPPRIGALESTANIEGRISAGTQFSRHNTESWREER